MSSGSMRRVQFWSAHWRQERLGQKGDPWPWVVLGVLRLAVVLVGVLARRAQAAAGRRMTVSVFQVVVVMVVVVVRAP